jgi:tetratricopeptide (TPR) repeat protein
MALCRSDVASACPDFVGTVTVDNNVDTKEALRLSPRDTSTYLWLVWVGNAKSQLGADEKAVAWYRRGIDANRNFAGGHFFLASALALLGRLDEARAAAQAGLSLDSTSLFAGTAQAHRPTIRPISPGASASLTACARPGSRKDKRSPIF